MPELHLPKALTTPKNKIHPDIEAVRDIGQRKETDEAKRLRLAKEGEELKQERKRERFFRKHGKKEEPYYARAYSVEGMPQPVMAVNAIEGARVGRKDAKTMPSVITITRPERTEGRISKQDPAGRSPESAGFNPQFRDFWKARIKTQTKKGPSYSRVSAVTAENLFSKREAAYLHNHPEWNPAKAERNQKTPKETR